jgi:asparagine synthase (glutamine-hydrolysing)
MCGIFALLNNDNFFTQQFVEEQFRKGKKRGPEYSVLKNVMIKADFGFHRLAINGLNPESNQPLYLDDIALICNGEIYNYKELYEMIDMAPNTDSDCEVILHLYKNYGIEQTLQLLDGVFSFILIDYRICNETSKIYIARDPYGVRPLYVLKPVPNIECNESSNNVFAFASEMKVLSEINKKIESDNNYKSKNENNFLKPMFKSLTRIFDETANHTIEQVPPGSYSIYNLPSKVSTVWKLEKENIFYHSTGFQSNIYSNNYNMKSITDNIQYYLTSAIYKRCVTTERPIASLLSGGLDSSLITALVNDFHRSNNLPTIETYSIGLHGSEDLRYARLVAEYLGTKHTEIILTEEEFIDAIPYVIRDIESYDTTTVRASIGNWLLGKYISENSDAKVIFNGDGSDELLGGYLYMHKAPDTIEFDKECRRLLKDIYMFDVLRSDKSISSHGLEPRTPFLDRAWVQYYLSIPMHIRNHNNSKQCEKFLLRNAFSSENYHNNDLMPLLPDNVLWRKKEAFSDGVSKSSRSLYEIIQEYTDKFFINEQPEVFKNYKEGNDKEKCINNCIIVDEDMKSINGHLVPRTTEQYYYRKIFERYYSGLGKILPYFWMPRYVNAKDASARTLEIYNDKK